jgi:hypothetical protein
VVSQRKAPGLFTFVPNNPTGHYQLELAKKSNKVMLQRLVQFCAEEKQRREAYNLSDTSQHGDMEVRAQPSQPPGTGLSKWTVDWRCRLDLAERASKIVSAGFS